MKHLLKGFKKISENEKETVFEHPNGHQMKIANKSLGKDMQKRLSDLPAYASGGFIGDKDRLDAPKQDKKEINNQSYRPGQVKPSKPQVQAWGYADGGIVEKIKNAFSDKKAEVKTNMDPDKAKAAQEGMRKAFGYADGGEIQLDLGQKPQLQGMMKPPTPMYQDPAIMAAAPYSDQFGFDPSMMQQGQMQNTAMPNSEQPLENITIPQAQPQQAPMAQGMEANPMVGGAPMGAGFNMEAQAMAQQGRGDEQAAQEHQKSMMDMQKHYEVKSTELDNERMAAYKDLQAGHIEPKHYLQSMNGYDKAMNAIGMILSGIGSGMSGQPNMAMEYINKQIERDIEAQKAELGKKDNLVTLLDRQMGNLKDATNMAKAMQSDMYATKLQEVAAKSKDPLAKARAMQAIQELHFKYDGAMQETKQRQAILSGMKAGSKLPPTMVIENVVPKEQRAKAYDELKSFQEIEAGKKMLQETMKEAGQINTVANRITSPLQSKSQMSGIEIKLLKVMKPIFNNLSETDKVQAMSNLPKATDNQETMRKKERYLMELMDSGAVYPILNDYGLAKPSKTSFTPR